MIGWILFVVTLSIFVAYIVIVKLEWELVDAWDILRAIFWPITLLVWLARRPFLRPMWTFIGKGFILLGRALAFLFIPVLGPIASRISALWFRWLDRWPESKRFRIRSVSILLLIYALIAIIQGFRGRVGFALFFFVGGAAAALIIILVTYLQSRRERVSLS